MLLLYKCNNYIDIFFIFFTDDVNKWLLQIPSHFKRVATLPCEIKAALAQA